jgi:hypothetical protein
LAVQQLDVGRVANIGISIRFVYLVWHETTVAAAE